MLGDTCYFNGEVCCVLRSWIIKRSKSFLFITNGQPYLVVKVWWLCMIDVTGYDRTIPWFMVRVVGYSTLIWWADCNSLWDDAWCWLMSYQMRGVRVQFSATWVLVHSVYNLVDVWYIMSTRVHSCITFFAFANIRVRTCNLLLQYTSQKTLSFWFEYATDCTIISAVNYEYYIDNTVRTQQWFVI